MGTNCTLIFRIKKWTLENSSTYKEEMELEACNTHRTYWKQNEQRYQWVTYLTRSIKERKLSLNKQGMEKKNITKRYLHIFFALFIRTTLRKVTVIPKNIILEKSVHWCYKCYIYNNNTQKKLKKKWHIANRVIKKIK